MNAERIINMVIRQVLRRFLNRGINAGIDTMTGKHRKAKRRPR
ncbi:hypothetical protein [Pseudooceanicola sp.]